MNSILLALALWGPVPADAVPISYPVPVIRQAVASYALLPVAAQDPATDAINAFDAAKATLVALRDQLLAEAAEKLRQAAAITQKLGGESPKPKPDPMPPPGPVLSDTAAKVKALAATVPANARGAASRLAAAYRAQAAAITDADTTDAIILRSREANRAALAGDIEGWRQFFADLKVYLDSLAAAGTLKTPGDHRREWLAIADGLSAGVAQR